MAVVVDKARGDSAAFGVDRARRSPAQFADLEDLAVLDAEIAAESGHSRTVDNQPILDQQIISHRICPPLAGLPVATHNSEASVAPEPVAGTPCERGKP